MDNLPQSLSMSAAAACGGPGSASASPSAAGTQGNKDRKMMSAEQLVLELSNPDLRENALLELSKVYISIYDNFTITLMIRRIAMYFYILFGAFTGEPFFFFFFFLGFADLVD